MLSAVLLLVVAYILAALPFGYWTVKVVKGVDIREYGSKSTGATNVWRVAGKQWGIFVFALDVIKGLVSVTAAHILDNGAMAQEWAPQPWNGNIPHIVPMLVAMVALVGHSKSIFLGGQGGKSAATGLGTLLGLNPLGGLLTFATWFIILRVWKMVSLASILGVMMCGVYFYLLHSPPTYVAFCIFGFIWVTWRHKANIKRMLAGTEPKIGQKKEEQQ